MWQIISGYLSVFIMMFGVFVFAKIGLNDNSKINKKKLLLIITFISMPQTIIFLNITGIFKTIIMSGINMIFYRIK